MRIIRLTHMNTCTLVLLAAAGLQQAGAADQAAPPTSAEALVAQAAHYEHGEGVKRDPLRAADLYCKAAHMGSAEAAFRLGWMYATARGIDRDDGYAVALFQRAAGMGHEYATRMLQLIKSDDIRLPDCVAGRDPAASVAASAGNPAAGGSGAASAGSISAGAATAEIHKTDPSFPAERPPGEPGTATDRQAISAALSRWADAWSRQDFENYFAAYARNFSTASDRTGQQWRAQRHARIANKSWINVKISAVEISIEGASATVRFRQDYRSDRLNDSGMKTLGLVKAGGKWLIRRERSEH